jgi:hypothetical protein
MRRLLLLLVVLLPSTGAEVVFTTTASICNDNGGVALNCVDTLLIHSSLLGGAVSATTVRASVPAGSSVAAGNRSVETRRSIDVSVRSVEASVGYRLFSSFTLTPPVVVRSSVTYTNQQTCRNGNAGSISTTVCCAAPASALVVGGAWIAYTLASNSSGTRTCSIIGPPKPQFTVEATLQGIGNGSRPLRINVTDSLTEARNASPNNIANFSLFVDTVSASTAERVDLQSYALCTSSSGSEPALLVPRAALNDYRGSLGESAAVFTSSFACPATLAAATAQEAKGDALSPYRSNVVGSAFPPEQACSVSRMTSSLATVQCATHAKVTTVAQVDAASNAMLIRRYAQPVVSNAGILVTSGLVFVDLTNTNERGGDVVLGASSTSSWMCTQLAKIETTPVQASVVLKAYATVRTFFVIADPLLPHVRVNCSVAVYQFGELVATHAFGFDPPTTTPAPSTTAMTKLTTAPATTTPTTVGVCDEEIGCTTAQCAAKYALADPPRTLYLSSARRCVAPTACGVDQKLDTISNTCIGLNVEGTGPPSIPNASTAPKVVGSVGVTTICVRGVQQINGSCVCDTGYSTGARNALTKNNVVVLCNSTAFTTPSAESASITDSSAWIAFVGGLWPWGLLLVALVVIPCCCCCCRRLRKSCCSKEREVESPSRRRSRRRRRHSSPYGDSYRVESP